MAEPAQAVDSSSSSSSSSSSRPPPKRKRPACEEKPKRLHHCIFSAPVNLEGDVKTPDSLGREGFACLLQKTAEEIFEDRNRLTKFSVWKEFHKNGKSHLHAVCLLDKPGISNPWLKALKRENCHVYFEHGASEYYWSVILYLAVPSATKPQVDTAPFLSESHPSIEETLKDIPRGANRSDKERARAYLGKRGLLVERRTMDHSEFAQYVIKKELRSKTALLAFLKKSKDEESRAAENYVFRYSEKLDQKLTFAWLFAGAPARLEAEQATAWDMVVQAGSMKCECGGKFIPLLENNLEYQCAGFSACLPQEEKPAPKLLKEAFVKALKCGAMKHTNPFLYGPRNSGKSTALAGLECIFGDFCFRRPSGRSNYVMQGVLHKKASILQDLRPTSLHLSWDSLLVWLEGSAITVPVPRNQGAEDVLYTSAAPVFVSSGEKFRIGLEACMKENISDREKQNDMMDSRFRFFAFPCSRPAAELIQCPPCGRCMALWLQAGESTEAAAGSQEAAAAESGDMDPFLDANVAAAAECGDMEEMEEFEDPFQDADDYENFNFVDFPQHEDCEPL